MFETERSYHEYLFSGPALQIGKIHWFLLSANTKIESNTYKPKTEISGEVDFESDELTDFGNEVYHDVIHWWVFSKETDIELLLHKTKSVLKAVKTIRNSPLLSKITVHESYKSIILDIENFTKICASEINELYEYVFWLNEKNNLAPSILFSRDVWRSTRVKYERLLIKSDLIDENSILLKKCTEFALGLRDEPFEYTLLKMYYEIDSEADRQDPENRYDNPTSYNHKKIVPFTSNQVIKNISMYFKLIYNSLESIIKKVEEYNRTPVITTPQNIYVSPRAKNIIRIATVQLDFELSNEFPPKITNKKSTKEKIKRAIEKSIQSKADIICLPELSICESWIPEIQELCKDKIVIAGVNYDYQNHNICKLISAFNEPIFDQLKITPSDLEEGDEVQPGMTPGKKLFIYHTKFGNLSILICRDFPKLRHHLNKNVDLLFVPSFNKDTERFHDEAHSHVLNYSSYVVMSNTAKYGGTSIFGTVKNTYFTKLRSRSCKEENDDSYKLCELKAGEEGIIIADFNLDYKAHQVPTKIDPSSVTKPVNNVQKIKFD